MDKKSAYNLKIWPKFYNLGLNKMYQVKNYKKSFELYWIEKIWIKWNWQFIDIKTANEKGLNVFRKWTSEGTNKWRWNNG